MTEKSNENLDENYQNFKENLEKCVQIEQEKLQIVNFSNFGNDIIQYGIYRLSILETLVKQNEQLQQLLEDTEAEKQAKTAQESLEIEQKINQKTQIIAEIQKYLPSETQISLQNVPLYHSQTLFSLLTQKLLYKIDSIKVYQKQSDYKKCLKILSETFQNHIF